MVGMLSFLQFGIILDFMLISPLGATIMPSLGIGPTQFGLIVPDTLSARGSRDW